MNFTETHICPPFTYCICRMMKFVLVRYEDFLIFRQLFYFP